MRKVTKKKSPSQRSVVFEKGSKDKKASEELFDNSEILSAIYSHLPYLVTVFEMDKKGNFILLKANKKSIQLPNGSKIHILKYQGASIQEYLRGALKMKEPKIREAIASCRNVIKTKKEKTFEDELTLSKKVTLTFDSSLIPILDAKGKCNKILSVGRDITKKKKAEREIKEWQENLKESEEMLAMIYNHTSDMMGLFEVKGDDFFFVSANNQVFESNNLNRVAGKDYFDLKLKIFLKNLMGFPDDDVLQIISKYKAVKKSKESLTFEQSVKKSGRPGIYIETTLSPVVNKNGRCTHILFNSKDITERKNSQKRIYENENRLKLALQTSKLGMFDWKLKKGIIYWDSRLHEIFGLKKNDKSDRRHYWTSIIHPEEKEKLIIELDRILRDPKAETVTIRYRVLLPGNKIRYILSDGILIKSTSGKTYRVIGTCLDYTDNEEAKKELAEREGRLGLILNSTSDMMLMLKISNDGQVRILSVNKAFINFFKRLRVLKGEDELLRKPVPQTLRKLKLPENQIQRIIENIKLVSETGQSYKTDSSFILGDGRPRYFQEEAIPILDPDNKFSNILFVVKDITDRIKVEEELRTSEENSRALINASNSPMFLINKDWTLINANKAFLKIVDRKFEDVAGKNVLELFPSELAQTRKAKTEEVIRTHKPVHFLDSHHGRHLDNQMTPLLDKDGNVSRIAVFAQDITERFEHEKEINAQNEQLLKSNLELDQFVYSVSHDLRAPIASSMGLINLIELEKDRNQIQIYVDLLRQSFNKLDRYIKDILNYSLNSRTDLFIEKINLQNLVEELFEDLAYFPGYNEIKREITIDNNGEFFSDARRLKIILNNLISNAIKYRDPQREQSFVKVEGRFDQSGNLSLKVMDNGKGIKKEYQDKIFQMFFRATTDSPGSGLGLYIVKETVAKLNGKIDFESDPDTGSDFIVDVPNQTVLKFISNTKAL